MIRAILAVSALGCMCQISAKADEPAAVDTSRGDKMIADYFQAETARVTAAALSEIKTLEDWTAKRDEYRRQLFEMLGLDPLPERTLLEATTTRSFDSDGFRVENVHFQSRPGLYVTGNLYVPLKREGKLPAILYVCGHGQMKKDGVSYGNKTTYQHHGEWFARNGYVCLTIDTLQLGEIEGIHHGTYRFGRWWWNSRGYSPAGVEAWNCIRALDYLQTREEVDAERIGVTGRSGGGAYSWWIAALDDRIKAAVPVAGITSLKNHVVDGCVEGHCDCMYHVNTYEWDFPLVAALVAPRPLLISNTDKDNIFPLDGVVDVYNKTRRIYELYDKLDHIGLNITEGPHKDTQELQVSAFHWMNRFLKKDEPLIEMAATKFFEPAELKVFDKLPADEVNTRIDETFTAVPSTPDLPVTASDWESQRDAWRAALVEKCFRGWPDQSEAGELNLRPAISASRDGIALAAYDFSSQLGIDLRLYLVHREGLTPADLELVVLNSLDEKGWETFLATLKPSFAEELRTESLPDADEKAHGELKQMLASFKWGMAYIAPRGIGPTAWNQSEKKQTQIQRRFMLLGQTLDGMRVWDIRRAAQALRSVEGYQNVPLWMQGERQSAGLVLYASLFEPNVARIDLWQLPHSHREGPSFLNVLRFLDTPQAVAMVAERSQVRIYDDEANAWNYPQSVAQKLSWNAKQLQIRRASPAEE